MSLYFLTSVVAINYTTHLVSFERSFQIVSLMVFVKEESSSLTVKWCWSLFKLAESDPKLGSFHQRRRG